MKITTHRNTATAALVLLLAVGLDLAPGAAENQDKAAREAGNAAIEESLDRTAKAFMDKDAAAIRAAFVENFAGPFRVPKVAQAVLDRVIQGAERIVADYQCWPFDVVDDRAAGVVEIDLRLEFQGGGNRELKGMFATWFVKEQGQWRILALERIASDWQPPAEKAAVWEWPEEGVSFPAPAKWQAYPIESQETSKSVVFVSPDVKANISVGLVPLPVPVSLSRVTANHKTIAQFYPGSRFIDEKPVKLAGRTGVATRMDVKVGLQLSRVVNRMVIVENALYVIAFSVSPSKDTAGYVPAFDKLCAGFEVKPPAKPAAGDAPAKTDGRRFAHQKAGIRFTAPEGWTTHQFDEKAAAKRGWLFGASVKPGTGDSFVLLGARDLPGAPPLDALQQGELNNIRAVAEDLKVSDEKKLTIGGCQARSWVCTFTAGQQQKRREIFFLKGTRLFFLIADACPPSEYAKLGPGIDKLIETIEIDTE